jgi:hypothetical protein
LLSSRTVAAALASKIVNSSCIRFFTPPQTHHPCGRRQWAAILKRPPDALALVCF